MAREREPSERDRGGCKKEIDGEKRKEENHQRDRQTDGRTEIERKNRKKK